MLKEPCLTVSDWVSVKLNEQKFGKKKVKIFTVSFRTFLHESSNNGRVFYKQPVFLSLLGKTHKTHVPSSLRDTSQGLHWKKGLNKKTSSAPAEVEYVHCRGSCIPALRFGGSCGSNPSTLCSQGLEPPTRHPRLWWIGEGVKQAGYSLSH